MRMELSPSRVDSALSKFKDHRSSRSSLVDTNHNQKISKDEFVNYHVVFYLFVQAEQWTAKMILESENNLCVHYLTKYLGHPQYFQIFFGLDK